MLTGLYSYGQAARLTHAYAAALSSTVDPIRSAPLATEHHPGQQQRHRQHRRRPMPIWVLKKILKTDTIPRSTRLTILCTVYQTRKNTMQQYDLLSRFSVHFEQPRAVIISYSPCGMCPGWVNRIDAENRARVPDAAAGLMCGAAGRARCARAGAPRTAGTLRKAQRKYYNCSNN